MKKSLFAAAAASFALLASAAQAQVAGSVGAEYAHSAINHGADLDQGALDAALQHDFGPVGAKLDAAIVNTGGAGLQNEVNYDITGHVNTKLGGAIVGGFAGVNATTNQTIWGLGLEGQTKLGEANSLYGQAGYAHSDDLDHADIWGVRAELRHFYADNIRVQASAGYWNADSRSVNVDAWNLGVEGEYQFAGTPWSVLAGYDYADADKLDLKSNTFRVGGRYTFGGATLKARDESGADFGSFRRFLTGMPGL
jgi:opacity protein-like surface antigen